MQHRKVVIAWLALIVAGGLVAMANDRFHAAIALEPARIWRGEVWRLVTWSFAWDRPAELLAVVSIYRMAPGLVEKWGAVRFAIYALATIALAGAAVSLVGLALPSVWVLIHVGGWSASWVVFIGHARAHPRFVYTTWSSYQVTSERVILMGLVFTAVCALAFGVHYLPQLFVVAFAAMFPV